MASLLDRFKPKPKPSEETKPQVTTEEDKEELNAGQIGQLGAVELPREPLSQEKQRKHEQVAQLEATARSLQQIAEQVANGTLSEADALKALANEINKAQKEKLAGKTPFDQIMQFVGRMQEIKWRYPGEIRNFDWDLDHFARVVNERVEQAEIDGEDIIVPDIVIYQSNASSAAHNLIQRRDKIGRGDIKATQYDALLRSSGIITVSNEYPNGQTQRLFIKELENAVNENRATKQTIPANEVTDYLGATSKKGSEVDEYLFSNPTLPDGVQLVIGMSPGDSDPNSRFNTNSIPSVSYIRLRFTKEAAKEASELGRTKEEKS